MYVLLDIFPDARESDIHIDTGFRQNFGAPDP
jgi:hypothetical protein